MAVNSSGPSRASPSVEVRLDAQNPWPSLHSFTEDHWAFFKGRQSEIDEMLRRVRRHRLSVIYGVSGLGKTSLLHAGLSLRLRESLCLPVFIRLDLSRDRASDLVAQVKAAIASAFQNDRYQIARTPLAEESLWEFFHRPELNVSERDTGRLVHTVLIFDQFEEFFTKARHDDEGRRQRLEFVTELASLIENRLPPALDAALDRDPSLVAQFNFDDQDCRIILSLREDYLAHLNTLAGRIPSIHENGFRLLRLTPMQALKVVAEAGEAVVDPGTAEKIVEFVAGESNNTRLRSPADASRDRRVADDSVSPALLSLVCFELNAARKAENADKITQSQVETQQGGILESFYDRCFAELSPSEQQAARWFVETKMLTADEHRNFVSQDTAMDDLSQRGLTREQAIRVLEHLRDHYLMQFEDRDGRVQVELTHDILTRVVAGRRMERRNLKAEQEKREAELRNEKLRGQLRRTRLWNGVFAAITLAMLVAVLLAIQMKRKANEESSNAQRNERLATKNQQQALKARQLADRRKDEAAQSLAELYARQGHSARQDANWGEALSYYREALLAQSNHLGARLGCADALANFMPEAAQIDLGRPITAAAFSPGGRWLALATSDSQIHLWSTRTWHEIQVLRGHSLPARCLAFAPDDNWLVSGSSDGTVRTWELRDTGGATPKHISQRHSTSNSLPALRGDRIWDRYLSESFPGETVRDVAVSSDGSWLASGSDDKTVRVWKMPELTELKTFSDHTGPVTAVAFTANLRWLVSASKDKTVRIWSTERLRSAAKVELRANVGNAPDAARQTNVVADTGEKPGPASRQQQEPSPYTHPSSVIPLSLIAGAEGQPLSILYTNGDLVFWDLERDRKESVRDLDAGNLSDSPLQALHLVGGRLGILWKKGLQLITVDPPLPLARFRLQEKTHSAVTASPDGQWLLTAESDGLVRIWQLAQFGRFQAFFSPNNAVPIRSRTNPSTTALANEAPTSGWLTQDWPKESAEAFRCMATTAETTNVVTVAGPALVSTWFEGALERQLVGQSRGLNWINCTAMSGKGVRLAEGCQNGAVHLRRLSDGALIAEWTHPKNAIVSALALSSDENEIAVGFENGELYLLNLSADTNQNRFSARLPRHVHEGEIRSLAFSAGGVLLASGGEDRTVRIWDVATGVQRALLRGHERPVRQIAFSPNGQVLASVADEKVVRLWNVAEGKPHASCRGHQANVRSIAFHPDGDFLVSGSSDNTIRCWDAKTGLPLSTFHGVAGINAGAVEYLGFVRSAAQNRGYSLALHEENGRALMILSFDALADPELLHRLENRLDLYSPGDLNAEAIPSSPESPMTKATKRLQAARRGALQALVGGGAQFLPLYEATEARANLVRQASGLYEIVERGNLTNLVQWAKRGRPLDTDCPFNTTPLTLACEKGYEDIVAFLLSHQVDVNRPDRNSRTPLQIALKQSHQKIIDVLLNNGADRSKAIQEATAHYDPEALRQLVNRAFLNSPGPDASSPLFEAVRHNDTNTAAYLLGLEARIDSRDAEGRTPLLIAAAGTNVSTVRFLVDHGAQLAATNDAGVTPLIAAVYSGHEEIASFLVDEGASVDVADESGWTPLLYAADGEGAQLVRLLLDAGANVDARSTNGWTPLMNAAAKGRLESARLLVQRGADCNATNRLGGSPLSVAAFQEQLEMARFLLDQHAALELVDAAGSTALHVAADKTNVAMVGLLLQRGARVDSRTTNGWTPLMSAAGRGGIPTAELLRKYKADLEATNRFGHSVLILAVANNQPAMAEYLLTNGASVKVVDHLGWSPVMWAAREAEAPLLQLLLDHGGTIEGRSSNGWTALMFAAESGRVENAQLVLEKKADPDERQAGGLTALSIAVDNNRPGVIRLLLKHGARAEIPDNSGWTPLMYSAWRGHLETATELLGHGAKLESTNNAKSTPLLIAAANHQATLVRLFVGRGADVRSRNRVGFTPLLFAAGDTNLDLVSFLLENGAESSSSSEDGTTPLMEAAQNDRMEIAKLLLDRGVPLEATNRNGSSALLLAAANQQAHSVQLLIERGANIQTRNIDGWTPLDRAAGGTNVALASFLLDKGAPIDVANGEGYTPLMRAIQERNVPMTEMLLRRGASLAIHAENGETPAWLAAATGDRQLLQLVLRHTGAPLPAQSLSLLPSQPYTFEQIERISCAAALAEIGLRYAEAETIYTDALALIPEGETGKSPWELLCWSRLATLSISKTNYAQAAAWSEKIAAMFRSAYGLKRLPAKKLSSQLSNLGWYLELSGQFDPALSVLEEGTQLDPPSGAHPIHINRAHAYLFTGRSAAATELYLKYKGEKFSDERQWNAEVRNDFELFRQLIPNISRKFHQEMEQVLALLKPAKATANR